MRNFILLFLLTNPFNIFGQEVKNEFIAKYGFNEYSSVKAKVEKISIDSIDKLIEGAFIQIITLNAFQENGYAAGENEIESVFLSSVLGYEILENRILTTRKNHYEMAKLYQLMGYNQNAIEIYTKSIECKSDSSYPSLVSMYNERADSKYTLGDYYGSIKDYTKAIEILNYIPEQPGKKESFKERLIRQIDENKKATIYLNRGRSYYLINDFSSSISDINTSIILNDKNGFAFYCRGIVYSTLDKKKESCLDFSRAGELGEKKAFEAITKFCNE